MDAGKHGSAARAPQRAPDAPLDASWCHRRSPTTWYHRGRPGGFELRVRTAIAVGLLGCVGACAQGEIEEASTVTFGGFSTGAATSDGDDTDSTGASAETGADGSGSASAEEGSGSGGSASGPGTDGSGDMGCVPSDEICDGLDNDCDDAVDEEVIEGGQPCDTGMPGVCAMGTSACQAGSIVCVSDTAASAEVCDGLDNDCDGTADQGNPGGGMACNTAMPGACASGTTSCQNAVVDCVPDQMATSEVCDDIDNDCDGTVDEGNPGGGGACSTGLPGVCSAGTMTCDGGNLDCVQDVAMGAEACNDGLDNDCDGSVDEGCGCAHDLCVTGPALTDGCAPCVTTICGVDPYCCNNSWDSICVSEVSSECGQVCQGTCSHSPCSTGSALVSGCDPGGCVTQICTVDAFCCDNAWDSLCVDEVASVCGLSC